MANFWECKSPKSNDKNTLMKSSHDYCTDLLTMLLGIKKKLFFTHFIDGQEKKNVKWLTQDYLEQVHCTTYRSIWGLLVLQCSVYSGTNRWQKQWWDHSPLLSTADILHYLKSRDIPALELTQVWDTTGQFFSRQSETSLIENKILSTVVKWIFQTAYSLVPQLYCSVDQLFIS